MSKAPGKQRQERSLLLELPAELRLNIYDHILGDPEAITITARKTVDEEGDRDTDEASDSNVSWRRVRRVPIIKNFYDPSLLGVAEQAPDFDFNASIPPTRSCDAPKQGRKRHYDAIDETASLSRRLSAAGAESSTQAFSPDIPTPLALLQTCKQISSELKHHISTRQVDSPTLYITYPHGVTVLKEHCPHLLKQARAINICGPFLPGRRPHECSGRWCCPGQAWKPSQPLGRTESPVTLLSATQNLIWLVRSVLSPKVHPVLKRLEMRIYYTEADAYHEVWTNEQSPISVAMPNICGGKIVTEVWRSKFGAGVFLRARPNPAAREISAGWRKLGDTREENEGFVISDQWGKSEDAVPADWRNADRMEEAKVGVTFYSGTRFTGNGGIY